MAFYKVRLTLLMTSGAWDVLMLTRDVALPFPPFDGLILAGLGARLGLPEDPCIASISYDVEGNGGNLTAALQLMNSGPDLDPYQEPEFRRRAEAAGWRVEKSAATGS